MGHSENFKNNHEGSQGQGSTPGIPLSQKKVQSSTISCPKRAAQNKGIAYLLKIIDET